MMINNKISLKTFLSDHIARFNAFMLRSFVKSIGFIVFGALIFHTSLYAQDDLKFIISHLQNEYQNHAKKLNHLRYQICKRAGYNKAILKKIKTEDFYLIRYGHAQDYFAAQWKSCNKGLYRLLFVSPFSEIRKDLIELLLEKDPTKAYKAFTILIKKESNIELRALLKYAVKRSRRYYFSHLLKKNPEKLQKMSGKEFFYWNGVYYPTAIHLMGYKAMFPLLQGLRNKDRKVRRYTLHALYYVKTDYNKNYIKRDILQFMRTSQYKNMIMKNDKKEFEDLLTYYSN